MDMKRLAKDIRVYRAKENISQEEFANLIGVAARTISQIENNKTKYIKDRTLDKLKELKIGLYIDN